MKVVLNRTADGLSRTLRSENLRGGVELPNTVRRLRHQRNNGNKTD